MASGVRASLAAARITVRVTARAGRDAIDGWDGGVLRLRVAAAPAKGKANEAVARLLAAALAVPPSRVAIASGARSRLKSIAISGITLEDACARLGRDG